MIRLPAALLFIALLAVSGAVTTVKIVSPVRQRQIKKLTVRQRELQEEVIQADQDIQKFTRERQVFGFALKTASRKLSSAVADCEEGLSCGHVPHLRASVAGAQEKLSSIKKSLSELKDPERVQRRQEELADVSGQIGFLTKMVFPRPSVIPRPTGRRS